MSVHISSLVLLLYIMWHIICSSNTRLDLQCKTEKNSQFFPCGPSNHTVIPRSLKTRVERYHWPELTVTNEQAVMHYCSLIVEFSSVQLSRTKRAFAGLHLTMSQENLNFRLQIVLRTTALSWHQITDGNDQQNSIPSHPPDNHRSSCMMSV